MAISASAPPRERSVENEWWPGVSIKSRPGEIEVVDFNEIAGHIGDRFEWNGRRADMLGDRAGLALADRRPPDLIQQAGLAVVDVAEDSNDRGSQ
jgi:hypothetical protein